MDNYIKFKVEEIVNTRSGSYAKYITPTGGTTLTGNYGFKKGDVVEMWGYDGYAPEKIAVNGVNTWAEEDRIKWWQGYDPENNCLDNPNS